MGDDIAGPSLLLAKQDLAHREHLHQHNHFHKREATAVVTEVVATVSVVQQVGVDSNGSIFTTETLLAITDESAAATTTAPASPPSIVNLTSAPTSTPVEPSQPDTSPALQSLLSSQSTTSASTTRSIPTRFPSLILSSNSTSLISSSSSSPFSNSSIISSRTSLTYLTSSSLSSNDFTDSSTSTLYSPSLSATGATSTGAGGYAGGTQATSGSTSSSTAGSGNGTSDSSTPSTPVVVGGVVGGLAGAAIVIFLLMFLIRWKKRHQSMLLLDSVDRGTGATATRDGPAPQPSGGMTERRSLGYGVPATLATLAGYKRSSQKTETDRTISSTAGSERGFYRVSGRKLPSVLQSGGDGYGGGGIDTNTLSGSSFYQDSQGFYGGPGSSSSPPHRPVGISIQRDSGVPVLRPSPARTPVTEQSPFSAFPAPPTTPPRRPDVLGRSHPSQDGSHASRFTEEV